MAPNNANTFSPVPRVLRSALFFLSASLPKGLIKAATVSILTATQRPTAAMERPISTTPNSGRKALMIPRPTDNAKRKKNTVRKRGSLRRPQEPILMGAFFLRSPMRGMKAATMARETRLRPPKSRKFTLMWNQSATMPPIRGPSPSPIYTGALKAPAASPAFSEGARSATAAMAMGKIMADAMPWRNLTATRDQA